MNSWLKLTLYLVMVTLTCVSGYHFFNHYSHLGEEEESSRIVTAGDDDVTRTVASGRIDKHYGSLFLHGALLLVFGSGLGLLATHDLLQMASGKASGLRELGEDEIARDETYEQAEAAHANGEYLRAVDLLRTHLKRKPNALYAQLRIADIYRQNLNNHRAAAMEYEEILKRKLKPERWGQTAIRLANVYSGQLGQSQKAIDLLRRLAAEYPQTKAAEKARQRLGIAPVSAAQDDTDQ